MQDVIREMKELAAEHGVDTDIATLTARLTSATAAADPAAPSDRSAAAPPAAAAAARPPAEPAAGGADDGDDDSMLEFEEEGLSPAEHARLRQGLALLEGAFLVVRGAAPCLCAARCVLCAAQGEQVLPVGSCDCRGWPFSGEACARWGRLVCPAPSRLA